MNTSVQERETNLRVPRPAEIAHSSSVSANIEISSILEAVMVLGWPEVMKEYPSGLLHVEYRTSPDDFIEYLKVFSSGLRGYWQLVCEYWDSALWSHEAGLSFGNGGSSALMTEMLKFVMDHQNAFLRRHTPTHNVLLQVDPPTEQETAAARECMRQAVQRVGDNTRINATAEEAATNEGMAEKPEDEARRIA